VRGSENNSCSLSLNYFSNVESLFYISEQEGLSYFYIAIHYTDIDTENNSCSLSLNYFSIVEKLEVCFIFRSKKACIFLRSDSLHRYGQDFLDLLLD